MLTRGRSANHVYVSVVGDGDPHTVIQPDSVHPRTATELLEQILARDAAPQSATTLQREQQDPAVRLGAAVGALRRRPPPRRRTPRRATGGCQASTGAPTGCSTG